MKGEIQPMNRKETPLCTLLLCFALLLGTAVAPLTATAEDDEENRVEKVHKIVIDCEEGSGEDCQRQIRIEKIGDDSHVMHLGDHEMTWVTKGEHGSHFGFGPAHLGSGAFLGVQLIDLTAELRSHFGVSADEGVMVARVVDDSPAFRAGLTAGDIITRIDGESVASASSLAHSIRGREEGDLVDLEVWRDGSAESFQATLDRQEFAGGMHRSIMIDCGDDESDCAAHVLGGSHRAMAIDCPPGEECEIGIECREGDCDCTLNGDSIDCAELHAVHEPGD
jgi:hypothetical protein